MRKGFTLLELIIVIIIIGILATLGFVQYSAVIEKSRGAEARATISTLRSQVAAKGYDGTTGAIVGTDLGITTGMVPPACALTNYFSYSVTNCSTTLCTFVATRCTASGKLPNAAVANTLTLAYTSGGGDVWASNGGY